MPRHLKEIDVLKYKKMIAKDSSVKPCKVIDCYGASKIQDHFRFKCPVCLVEKCFKCEDEYHSGKTCDQNRKDKEEEKGLME